MRTCAAFLLERLEAAMNFHSDFLMLSLYFHEQALHEPVLPSSRSLILLTFQMGNGTCLFGLRTCASSRTKHRHGPVACALTALRSGAHLALDALVDALDILHDHDLNPHDARRDYSFEGRQGQSQVFQPPIDEQDTLRCSRTHLLRLPKP